MSGDGQESAAALTPLEHISGLTSAKIRTFLFEVAEGVSNYRSLHSLTQQVEHQYHGRFLIELVQNAHDALWERVDPSRPSRIAVILDPKDSPYGSLLVANDGHPFNQSNFDRLSQLGQSDKDPQKSIGNKGLGFRSVLEVSERPEVYSRARVDSEGFDGYCFAFEPEVVHSLVEPMQTLAAGQEIPVSPVSAAPIVDWSEPLLHKFRKRVRAAGHDWLRNETKYLSPYLLPVPRGEIRSEAVRALEAQGFATVVRLPLKSLSAKQLTRRHINELSSSTLLFLERVSALELTIVGGPRQVITRSVKKVDGQTRVSINDGTHGAREYATWVRELHVASEPQAFRTAVAALPGRWPEIQDVSVSVAVRLGDTPEPGNISIYLPTNVSTGSAVHVNAPFYGDMSRTHISFDDGYNKHLLNTAVELTADVARKQLAGKGPEEAQMIVDMIAPLGNDPDASNRWCEMLDAAAERTGGSLDSENLALAEAGWRPLNETSLVPEASKTSVLTEAMLRKHATFDVFHTCLRTRKQQLLALALRRCGTGAYPTSADLASTVASVAEELHAASNGNWNAFWRDVLILLPHGQKELAKHKVILGSDGQLHSAADVRMFFIPRQGTLDDSDGSDEGGTIEVPPSLQSSIAFLNEAITVYDPQRQTVQTPVRAYLFDGGLVAQFRVEIIFTSVLRKAIPELPASLDGPDSNRCRDVLTWSLRLIGNVVARDRGSDALLNHLKQIPVPCQGGWFQMSEASFGEGWPGSAGELLVDYLRLLEDAPGKEEAAHRVLLAPNHAAWGDVGLAARDLLVKGGVFDGLRLQVLRSEDWASSFPASSTEFPLPIAPPPGIEPTFWSQYRGQVAMQVRGGFSITRPYVVGPLMSFPGMTQGLSPEASIALCQLILRSACKWPKDWEIQSFSRVTSHEIKSTSSPLCQYLRTHPWIEIALSSGTTWSRPSDCWHVPAHLVSRRATHYAHLHALPYELAKLLDGQDGLAAVMYRLGMPHLDLNTQTHDPKLIVGHVSAIGSNAAPEVNVLLGHIRDAWRTFRPKPDQARLPLLPVRDRDHQLLAQNPDVAHRVYLPDLGTLATDLEQFGLHVVAIYPEDARALRQWFASAYGSEVIPTSDLKLMPHVEGEAWRATSGIPLTESELAWMIAPLLTLVAFHGQIRGLHSAAFQERLALLQEAQVEWAPEAEIVVANDQEELMRTPVMAHWDSHRKTLLVTEACRHLPAKLSPALSQMLARDDLELPLKLMLGNVRSIEEQPDDLIDTLSELHISEEQLKLVQEHRRGDVGHTARMIQLLCMVLARDDQQVADVKAADSTAPLLMAMTDLGVPKSNADSVLQIASESLDLQDFGMRVSRIFGPRASLSRWNVVLAQIGDRLISNRDWQQELRAHLEEARGLIKRLIAHVARNGDGTHSYTSMLAEYERLPPEGTDLSGELWEVDFAACMGIVAALAASWGDAQVANSIRSAANSDDLRQSLESLGVLLVHDPDESSRLNHQLIARVVDGVERLRQAGSLAGDANAVWPEISKVARDEVIAALKNDLGDAVFVQALTEQELFASIRTLKLYTEPASFGLALEKATDLASLQSRLEISNEDLAGVSERVAARRAEAQRRQHMVSICGDEFDASEDNRSQLLQFLKDRIRFEELASTSPLDLSRAVALLPIKPGDRRTRTTTFERKKSSRAAPRQSKAVDELVGLAGEIFVFEMLKRKYGADIVTASSWVSENSRYVFEDNHANDAMGCDFAFTVRGRVYHVEVKATAGDDEALTLGSSEISLAMDLASRKKRRRGRFILVHVRKTLSATPDAIILPNPYETSSSNVFTIEEAGARVRYRTE